MIRQGGKTIAVVICAAGSSSRMGGLKKEYRPLPGSEQTVLGAAVAAFAVAFAEIPSIHTVIIAVPDNPETGEAAARNALPKEILAGDAGLSIRFVPGGKNRQASVYNALTALSVDSSGSAENPLPDYVLIHDGGRPWIKSGLIQRLIAEVKKRDAVIPVLPLTETPKEILSPLSEKSEVFFIKRHLKRACVGAAQTPQAFAFSGILAAHQKAASCEGVEFTDDAEIWAEFCGPVAAIPGDPENRKITFPEDL